MGIILLIIQNTNNKILICGSSNKSIDEIYKRLAQNGIMAENLENTKIVFISFGVNDNTNHENNNEK